jgi:1,4-dihydroxy-2-naphthoate octaprenyltransferase
MTDEETLRQTREDIAVIKNQIINLCNKFDDFKDDSKKYSDKLNSVENKQLITDQKVSNMTVFQSIFSIIVGAIATYLGVRRN